MGRAGAGAGRAHSGSSARARPGRGAPGSQLQPASSGRRRRSSRARGAPRPVHGDAARGPPPLSLGGPPWRPGRAELGLPALRSSVQAARRKWPPARRPPASTRASAMAHSPVQAGLPGMQVGGGLAVGARSGRSVLWGAPRPCSPASRAPPPHLSRARPGDLASELRDLASKLRCRTCPWREAAPRTRGQAGPPLPGERVR